MAKSKKRRTNSGQTQPCAPNSDHYLALPVNQGQLQQLAREQHISEALSACAAIRTTLEIIVGKLDRLRYT